MLASLMKAVWGGEGPVDGHKGTVRQVACSPDGTLACSASGDHTCILWDISSGTPALKCRLGTIPEGLTGGGQGTGHGHIVTGVAFSPDGKYIATVSYDKSVRVWSSEGDPLAVMHGHTQIANCCAFTPDGRGILSGSTDKTLKLWRLKHQGTDTFDTFPWGKGVVLEFAFAQSMAPALTDNHGDSEEYNNLMQRHRAHMPDMKCDLVNLIGHSGAVNICAFSPDGKFVLSGSSDCSARLWHAGKITSEGVHGAPALVLKAHNRAIISGAFSPTSDKLVTGSEDGTANVHLTATGELLQRIDLAHGYAFSVSFLADGLHVVVCTGGSKLRVQSVATGKLVGSADPIGKPVSTFAWSAGQQAVVCGLEDFSVKMGAFKMGPFAQLDSAENVAEAAGNVERRGSAVPLLA
mmetsp:Transcript_28063/g.65316  ORF Transcript_28063/g.65316 Transcript_28063/m.65316 type:complete len:408 (+) Transcript_28063:57-1280(+)|eukprot:CAMPEP_0180209986 /NCGR_PEP_ID=MMETSP0987-20121128/11798_1 /TAXON_ID=697907 /ORGANISM="non described non described, Strain CCMP2293" /LENGTH=407 /DNA_ID=CAMNT_0022166701 /DNA_START=57 /DNA_END=1280 /DNA_ORIENTATION=+